MHAKRTKIAVVFCLIGIGGYFHIYSALVTGVVMACIVLLDWLPHRPPETSSRPPKDRMTGSPLTAEERLVIGRVAADYLAGRITHSQMKSELDSELSLYGGPFTDAQVDELLDLLSRYDSGDASARAPAEVLISMLYGVRGNEKTS